MTRVLMVDDHPMIRTAIDALLRDTDYEICGTASSVGEALERLEAVKPDVLLLDLQMPDGNGMEVVRKLKARDAAPAIVILTAGIDDISLLEARSLDVAGMVMKNSDPAYLLECLDQVRAGGTWVDPELSAREESLVGSSSGKQRVALAPRERQLVRFVRQGLRNREIAAELGVTEGTVKVYLHNIFDKLNVSSRTELAVRADEFLAQSFSKR